MRSKMLQQSFTRYLELQTMRCCLQLQKHLAMLMFAKIMDEFTSPVADAQRIVWPAQAKVVTDWILEDCKAIWIAIASLLTDHVLVPQCRQPV